MKADQIIEVLNRLCNSSHNKILISGKWGIGKTKYINDFLNAHLNSCYVSLFGKKDIESITQEMFYHIIDKTSTGKVKKGLSKQLNKLEKLNLTFQGISISIPFIKNSFDSLTKTLDKSDDYIIVLDDLERKHKNLSLVEILGLIDSLSKITNIKIILVGSEEKMTDEDSKTFKEYAEKAIDRIYKIDSYADEAPMNILGIQVWESVKNLIESTTFNNLRTLEKTYNFINEVLNEIDSRFYTEKFTKSDLYKICYATVIYITEHKKEKILLEKSKDDGTKYRNIFYSTDEGTIRYLTELILKNSLDNQMTQNIFPQILNWYDTGNFQKDALFNAIESINDFKEKPSNFYSSLLEIENIINYAVRYLEHINVDQKVESVVSVVTTAISWCDVLKKEFKYSNSQIMNMLRENISNQVDIGKKYYEQGINHHAYSNESQQNFELINLINDEYKKVYWIKMVNRIKDIYGEKSYNDLLYLRELNDSIYSFREEAHKTYLLNVLRENNYLFPLPSDKITEEHWYWCHSINILIKDLERGWEESNLYSEFKEYLKNLDRYKEDVLLQHRLKVLFKEI